MREVATPCFYPVNEARCATVAEILAFQGVVRASGTELGILILKFKKLYKIAW